MIAKPHLNLEKKGARFQFEYHAPDNILPHVTSKESLEKALDWYSNPFLKLRSPDDVKARRRYVEKVRPALRWFCKKFAVNVPGWLVGNGPYDELPKEEFAMMFGEGPFKVREYEELSKAPKETPDAGAQQ